jgi:hypothetical protein
MRMHLPTVRCLMGLFSPLRQHYETTQAFLRSIELLAPSLQAVISFRSHESYSIFEKRWQLPVYFQLRWKEIVGKLEESFGKTRLDVALSKGSPVSFFSILRVCNFGPQIFDHSPRAKLLLSGSPFLRAGVHRYSFLNCARAFGSSHCR